MNKDKIRNYLLNQRNNVKNRTTKENLITNKLERLVLKKKEAISGYIPCKSEVNVFPFFKKLSAKNFSICYPFILKNNHYLLFKEWIYGKTKLVSGKFNIPTPQNKKFLLPDVLFIPLVGFDIERNRIGYGGGFYDRTLIFLNTKKKILSIGVAFDEQEYQSIPVEKTDIKLDIIITQTRMIK